MSAQHRSSGGILDGCLNRTNTIIGIVTGLITILAFCGITSIFSLLTDRATSIAPTPASTLPTTRPTSDPVASDPAKSTTNQSSDWIESSNISNVFVGVNGIELVNNDQVMRWHFAFWNQSDQVVAISFYEDLTYVIDEFGTRYGAIDTQMPLDVYIAEGERIDYWIDFPMSTNGASSFSVTLAGPTADDNALFDTFTIVDVTY